MPLYYFHRRDTAPCSDDAHYEAGDLGGALAEANRMARTIIARSTDPSRLAREALDVENEARSVVARVMFADVLRATTGGSRGGDVC